MAFEDQYGYPGLESFVTVNVFNDDADKYPVCSANTPSLFSSMMIIRLEMTFPVFSLSNILTHILNLRNDQHEFILSFL